jgi:hypothetical protein
METEKYLKEIEHFVDGLDSENSSDVKRIIEVLKNLLNEYKSKTALTETKVVKNADETIQRYERKE